MRDGVAVRRPELQRLEHEDIERPLQHVAFDRRRPASRHAQEDNLLERNVSNAGRRLAACGEAQTRAGKRPDFNRPMVPPTSPITAPMTEATPILKGAPFR